MTSQVTQGNNNNPQITQINADFIYPLFVVYLNKLW